MTAPAPAHELAAAIGGEVRAGSLIVIRDGDRVKVVDCAHTGKVWLLGDGDDRYPLGSISDGVEHLAAMFYAATAEVPC